MYIKLVLSLRIAMMIFHEHNYAFNVTRPLTFPLVEEHSFRTKYYVQYNLKSSEIVSDKIIHSLSFNSMSIELCTYFNAFGWVVDLEFVLY